MRSVINESQAPAHFVHWKFLFMHSQNIHSNIIDRFQIDEPIFNWAMYAMQRGAASFIEMKTKYAEANNARGKRKFNFVS